MIRKLLPLLVLLFYLSVGTCSAAEITADELNRLEIIFNQLERNNNEQSQKLDKASALLKQSENQLQVLTLRLQTAEQSLMIVQASLAKANESLSKLEAEITSEKCARKAERLLWITALYLAYK